MKRQRDTKTTVLIKNPAFKKARKASLVNPPKGKRSMPEKKNVDALITTGFAAAATTGTITLLNGIDDGATATTRVGRKVDMSSLQFIFKCNMATTTTGAAPLRCVVVYDKQTNGVLPAITDIFAQDSITAPMNLANSKRFIVISDKIYNGIGTAGPQSLIDKQYYRINLPVEFNDNSTATITSINTGSIYLIQWQDGGLLTTMPVNTFFSRIRFTDM